MWVCPEGLKGIAFDTALNLSGWIVVTWSCWVSYTSKAIVLNQGKLALPGLFWSNQNQKTQSRAKPFSGKLFCLCSKAVAIARCFVRKTLQVDILSLNNQTMIWRCSVAFGFHGLQQLWFRHNFFANDRFTSLIYFRAQNVPQNQVGRPRVLHVRLQYALGLRLWKKLFARESEPKSDGSLSANSTTKQTRIRGSLESEHFALLQQRTDLSLQVWSPVRITVQIPYTRLLQECLRVIRYWRSRLTESSRVFWTMKETLLACVWCFNAVNRST